MRMLFGAAAMAAAFLAGPAIAADYPLSPMPYVPAPYSVYNWNGAYAGLNVGYQRGSVTNAPFNPTGAVGGLQGGYNWQNGPLMFGGEADIQISGAEDTFAAYKFSNPWFGTVRGRAGIAFSNVLLYVTAGLAYGDGKIELGNLSETHTSVGWTAGGGIEVGFTPHWSAKAEWLYLDFADRSFSVTGTNNGLTANLIRLGVNYHF
jgi:outer membrane immunogenic protein